MRGFKGVVVLGLLSLALCGSTWANDKQENKKALPVGSTYKFQGGERIRLIVPETVGATMEQLVSGDGYLSLPTGGTINVKGLTITEAQAAIKEQLNNESGARRVYASIALLDVPPRQVFIGGEVRAPQAILLPAGNSLTLAAALMTAGGALPEADLTRLRLIRGGDPAGDGIVYDATKLNVKSGNLGPVLEQGDVISVPRGAVFVLAGEVTRPGVVTRRDVSVDSGEPVRLSRVLFSTGGLRASANRKDIRLIRAAADGSKQVLPINLDEAVAASAKGRIDDKNDPLLQDGDTILAGATGGVSILGRVTRPGVYALSGNKMKLTRLIALSGGFTQFAKTSSVVVVRANSPNAPEKVDVGAITKDGELHKDVDLDDGDIVFVGERML